MKRTSQEIKLLKGILILLTLFLGGCSTPKPAADPKDLSYLYNPLKNSIYPRYKVINQTDDLSVLSVKFIGTELFFSEANPTGLPTANMFISVRLYNISQGRTLADTAFYDLDIVRDRIRDEYLYKIPLKVEKGSEYMTDIKVYDKIRQVMVQSFVPFNTLSEFNRYNFFVRGHNQRNEVILPIIKKNEYFNLVYTRANPDSLFISVYKPYEEIPYPPSMVLPEKPGATEPDTVVALSYSDTLPLMFPRKGIYFCSIGRDINEGYSLFNFGTEYPGMNEPETMIEPLAYLASPEEMDAIKSSPRKKIALDDFWIKCGGNIEKARELIRIFYTRVVYADYYFTSFKEGWRTDRGMIYIIYGPPDKIYKSNEEENWGYRQPPKTSKWGSRYTTQDEYLFFSFKKRSSKFTDNEFSLSRSETVITYWDKAVMSWRKGVVFRLDNPADL
jgi:GWxTD domain-containing protein